MFKLNNIFSKNISNLQIKKNHSKKQTIKIFQSLALACTICISSVNIANAQDSNRESVRASVSRGNWYLVWGETVNEAEYLKLSAAIAASVACECTSPIQGYFDDYYSRTVAKVKRNAPEVGQRILEDMISQAFDNPGSIRSYRGVEVAAGIATYNRWKRVVYDEPYTYKCKWKGPLGTWTWGVCNGMKRKEKNVPLPNWHQPYIKLRFTSQKNISTNNSSSSSSGARRFHVKNSCDRTVAIALRYLDTNNNWVSNGWWTIKPGKSTYLGKAFSNNSIFYFYAETAKSSNKIKWAGNENKVLNGRTLPMRKANDTEGDLNLNLTCD
ncbi:MAG: hypothetical protein Tsb0014_33020 [Pleurocapsa sp.]